MRHALICLTLAAGLAGCASTGEPRWLLSQVAGGLLPFVQSGPDPRYAALEEAGAQTLRAVPEDGPATVVLRRAATLSGGETLWLAPDGSGFTFDEGLLVATRGVGEDLVSADLSQLQRLLQTGQSGTIERFESTLDGEGQIILNSYVCTVTVAPELVREDCSGLTEDGFVNTYRLSNGSGQVISSRQRTGAGTYRFGP